LFLPLSTLRVSLPALINPANNHRAVPLTPDQFHFAFTNNLSEAESLAICEQLADLVPTTFWFRRRSPTSTPTPPPRSTSGMGIALPFS
jgi:hypothetical protein